MSTPGRRYDPDSRRHRLAATLSPEAVALVLTILALAFVLLVARPG